jgi:hypothetical protein
MKLLIVSFAQWLPPVQALSPFPCLTQFCFAIANPVPCETPLRSADNHCVVVRAGITIYTDNGGGRSAVDDMREVLKETIDYGLFNYRRMGIVRVSVFEE